MASSYTFTFSMELVPQYIEKILTAMPVTIYLLMYSLLFAMSCIKLQE
jgi:hypothetical protein